MACRVNVERRVAQSANGVQLWIIVSKGGGFLRGGRRARRVRPTVCCVMARILPERREKGKLLFPLLRACPFYASDAVLDFANEEIDFKGGLRFHCVQIRHYDVGKHLSETGYTRCLLTFVRFAVQID